MKVRREAQVALRVEGDSETQDAAASAERSLKAVEASSNEAADTLKGLVERLSRFATDGLGS